MDYMTKQGIEGMRRDRAKLADEIRRTQEIADSLKVPKQMDEMLARALQQKPRKRRGSDAVTELNVDAATLTKRAGARPALVELLCAPVDQAACRFSADDLPVLRLATTSKDTFYPSLSVQSVG